MKAGPRGSLGTDRPASPFLRFRLLSLYPSWDPRPRLILNPQSDSNTNYIVWSVQAVLQLQIARRLGGQTP